MIKNSSFFLSFFTKKESLIRVKVEEHDVKLNMVRKLIGKR